MTQQFDGDFFSASSQLFDRLASDPEFADKYGDDLAAGLQVIFPQITELPMAKLQEAIEGYRQQLEEVTATPVQHHPMEASGLAAAATGSGAVVASGNNTAAFINAINGATPLPE